MFCLFFILTKYGELSPSWCFMHQSFLSLKNKIKRANLFYVTFLCCRVTQKKQIADKNQDEDLDLASKNSLLPCRSSLVQTMQGKFPLTRPLSALMNDVHMKTQLFSAASQPASIKLLLDIKSTRIWVHQFCHRLEKRCLKIQKSVWAPSKCLENAEE